MSTMLKLMPIDQINLIQSAFEAYKPQYDGEQQSRASFQ